MSDPDSSIQYPCDFPIKAMGRADPAFQTQVVELVRRHAPDLSEPAVTARTSNGGRYVSITVLVRATSRAQLDAIYRDLTACEAVLMAL